MPRDDWREGDGRSFLTYSAAHAKPNWPCSLVQRSGRGREAIAKLRYDSIFWRRNGSSWYNRRLETTWNDCRTRPPRPRGVNNDDKSFVAAR